jgi:hypothetical protein
MYRVLTMCAFLALAATRRALPRPQANLALVMHPLVGRHTGKICIGPSCEVV